MIKRVTVIASAIIGAAAAAAASAAGAVYFRSTTASVDLSNDSGVAVTVKSVVIPAGTWLITAKATAVNFSEADYVRCQILVNGLQKDAAATLVGNAAPGPTGELGPSAAEIVLQAAVTTTVTRTFALACSHDFETSGIYVDPQASIMVSTAPGALN
jgi:hypothetical protein